MRLGPLVLTLVLLPAVGALVGCGGSSTEGAGSPSAGILFVQGAESAQLQERGESLTLRLSGADANVQAFADRPIRRAATAPTELFVDRWTEEFGDQPPNAALIARQLEDATPPIFVLDDPRYDAGRGVLAYRVEPVGDSAVPEGPLAEPTLFIDPAQTGETSWTRVTFPNATPGDYDFDDSVFRKRPPD